MKRLTIALSLFLILQTTAVAANVTVTEVTNLTSGQGGSLFKEDWINPFDPNYP